MFDAALKTAMAAVPAAIDAGRLEEAMATLSKAMAVAPDHPEVLLRLAEISIALGDLDEADGLLAAARRNGDARVRAGVRLGRADILHLRGRTREAEVEYREVLSQRNRLDSVGQARALYGLGALHLGAKRFAQAVPLLDQALGLNPHSTRILRALARACEGRQMPEATVQACRAWQELAPQDPELYVLLGNALCALNRLAPAEDALRLAIRLKPDLPVVTYTNLGLILLYTGKPEEALSVFESALERDPGNGIAGHLVAAIRGGQAPGRASDRYVRETFDAFARSFDEKLARLHYAAPGLIADALRAMHADPVRVLDLGCGTGLCGPLLKPPARHLVGVDLSSGMLAKARERGVYDELHEAEAGAYLAGVRGSFDAVVAADVFVYFGDLSEVIAGCAQALAPNGVFAFTVEALAEGEEEGATFRIAPNGRYRHAAAYVRQTVAAAGLLLARLDPVVLRMESGTPVHGHLVVAQPAAS